MNYELTPTAYQLLRKLMSDVIMLLSEFSPHSEYPPGFVQLVARDRHVRELITRCRNMMTLPEVVGTPVKVPESQRAAPPLPLPELPDDLQAQAEAAYDEYQQFAAPLEKMPDGTIECEWLDSDDHVTPQLSPPTSTTSDHNEIIESMQWTGRNYVEIHRWLMSWDLTDPGISPLPGDGLYITFEMDDTQGKGEILVQPGEWIGRMADGGFKTYQLVADVSDVIEYEDPDTGEILYTRSPAPPKER